MDKTVLIIDDDEKLNDLLKEYLSKFGFEVDTVEHPEKGLKALKQNQPDVIILDVMLPDMDGFEVCKEIRKTYSVPIIMLTARGDTTDRIVGLEIGADDYLPKPFEPRELVARMQSVLRRTEGIHPIEQQTKKYGKLTLDYNKRSAFLENNPIDLTTAEFEILSLLVSKSGMVLSRDRILNQVRGLDWEAFNRSVDVLISRLRQKLRDDPKHPQYIKTVWGTGYMFIGDEDA